MHIRLADLDESAAIAQLVERGYAHHVPRIGLRPAPMDADYESLVAGEHVWVAVDESLAGVLVVEAESDHLLVENLAVATDRQGRGVGSLLLDHAGQLARELALPELRLYTHVLMTENIAFYARRGFRETERRAEHGFSRVFMSKTC